MKRQRIIEHITVIFFSLFMCVCVNNRYYLYFFSPFSSLVFLCFALEIKKKT